MRNRIALSCIAVLLLFSCKKDEPVAPQTTNWNEDWACFTGTLVGTSDTLPVAFSSNQGAYCLADCRTMQSLMPWEDEARYSSSVTGFYKVEVKRGILFFNGTNWDDVPEDSAFVNYFRSGYGSLVMDDLSYTNDPGYEITFTDQNGWTYTSADHVNYGNQNYTCRITDYHPFTRNGVQYVKVNMFFNGIVLENAMGHRYTMSACAYEGYFKND